MPRVYRVTFTKTFEADVLAESETALREALDLDDIDTNWGDVPNQWDIDVLDIMKDDKSLPVELPEPDAVVVGTIIYAAEDEAAAPMKQRAEEELTQRWQAMKQLPLPFEKP